MQLASSPDVPGVPTLPTAFGVRGLEPTLLPFPTATVWWESGLICDARRSKNQHGVYIYERLHMHDRLIFYFRWWQGGI